MPQQNSCMCPFCGGKYGIVKSNTQGDCVSQKESWRGYTGRVYAFIFWGCYDLHVQSIMGGSSLQRMDGS